MTFNAWRHKLKRRLVWFGWKWRFRLLQRHRYNQLVIERVAEMPLVILPEVFNPTLFFTSTYFVQCFNESFIPRGAYVLDMGTGSGVGALVAARWARLVVAVDINPAAVRCARINTLLHQMESQVDVREGDLFAPVEGEQFDVVLFNPPFYHGIPRTALDHAWRSTDVMERFAKALPAHLTPRGWALVIWSANSNIEPFLEACAQVNLQTEVVAEKDLVGDRLIVYRVRR